jgi:ABC-type lipoprotein release transport system permease subunit
LKLVVRQLQQRPGRAVTLCLTLSAATAGFLLLASAGRTTDVRVQGSVRSAFRPAYDILVRPAGSKAPLERNEGLVRPNYLSGIFGGITLSEYRRIHRIRGVHVAAPIANLGYILPFVRIPIVMNKVVTRAPIQLYAEHGLWLAQGGLSRYAGGRAWAYYNRRDRFDCCGHGLVEHVPHRREPLGVCSSFTQAAGASSDLPQAYGPFDQLYREYIACYSARNPEATQQAFQSALPSLRSSQIGVEQDLYFPIFVAAIDPVEEARLLDVPKTVVSGRYLRRADLPEVVQEPFPTRTIPVIASTRTFVDDTLLATTDRLSLPEPNRVPFVLASAQAHSFLTGLKGRQVMQQRTRSGQVYEQLLRGKDDPRSAVASSNYWSTSPARYVQVAPDRLRVLTTKNPISVWKNNGFPENGGFAPAPPDNQDVQFRRLQQHSGSNLVVGGVFGTPSFTIVGRYDPTKLPGFSPLSRVPLETYSPPRLKPAGGRTKRLLHGRPLLPTQNLGDYIQQPPMLLTTLGALSSLTNQRYWSNVSPRMRKAPIAAIRVRVAGVTGPDRLSIARIKAVAAKIHDETALDVDITAGSSPHPVLIDLPEGKFGRPPLTLKEGWSKKGVSVAFLSALDSKRLGFLVVILLSSAFVVANGAFASVRQRRREIGTLLCLGWSPGEVFRTLLAELAALGLAAGLIGAGVAVIVAASSTLSLAWWQPLLVVPLALGLALGSGLLPAWQASRLVPLDAVRPAVSGEVAGRPVRHLSGLALANLRRVPVRSLVAVAGLTVGVTALALLVAINQAFQGTLVGTLLGGVVSLQVRGLDYLAVGLLIALSALALADVLYVNLRERQAELVTLRSLGWADAELRRLVALEAGMLGLLGSLAGVVLALLIGGLVGLPIVTLLLAALAAGAGGVAVALAASLLPLSQIGRFSVPTVLAEE